MFDMKEYVLFSHGCCFSTYDFNSMEMFASIFRFNRHFSMYSFVSDQPTHPNLQNKFACKFLTENNESPPEYANINETNIWKFCINQGKWKET